MFIRATRPVLACQTRRPRRHRHQSGLNDVRRLLFEGLEERRLLAADFDFGDAPDSYQTLDASGGAKHEIGSLFLRISSAGNLTPTEAKWTARCNDLAEQVCLVNRDGS